jgi:amino acid adenylation domain-containing protein
MDANIGNILEMLGNSQPLAPAIHVPGRPTLTYADLAGQIRYIRERLRGWGIGPGDVIAGTLPTRPEMAVACASVPASATFVPLSQALSVEAYSQLLIRLRPKAAIVSTDTRHPSRVAARRCGVAEIIAVHHDSTPAGRFTLDLARDDESLRLAATVGADIAYVICTSGTTGLAKLVPIAHRRSVAFAATMGDWSQMTARDVGCHLVPLHHGHGLNSALMVPLLRGSSIVCLPESDVDALYRTLDVHQPTWLTAVFTIYKEILRRADDYRDIVGRSHFRFFKVGSGALDSTEIDQLERLFRAPVLSALIAQEVFLVSHDPFPPALRKRGSVGVRVRNDVTLVGEAGASCAPGEIGEIVVRGPMVFDGYLDDPEATAAVFVDGWCRTGDLGHFDDDGHLFLAGRVKDLIHRGGEKFAPVRIDRAIEELPGVRAAAAFGVPHPTLGEEVAAAVVKEADAAIDEAHIIEHVHQQLGPKGAPRAIYFVDDLPRTDTGKVRRSELVRLLGHDRPAAPAPADLNVVAEPSALSPLEVGLSSLWSSVLQLRNVGLADDFFLLGGDSLRGVRLLAGVRALCSVELSFDQLLRGAATIAGMARAIEAERSRTADGQERHSGHVPIPPRIQRRHDRGPWILSDTQRRMWFLAQLEPQGVAYNESGAYRLRGDIDVAALDRSVRYIVGRHEILRTTYALVDDEPRQLVHDESRTDVEMIDLSATPSEEREYALQRVLLARVMKPFDHQSGPLLRCVIVRLADREHVFLRVWHHIVSDAWSGSIFDRELSVAYGVSVKKSEPNLSPLPVQYADYALWQQQRLQELLGRQLEYWKGQLSGVAILELPTDRVRSPSPSHQGAHVSFDLSAGLTRALKELGRHEGATLFMTLLAAYQVLLHRYSGQDDIAVGTPIAGRAHSDLEGLIGFFANTLVLRSDLSGDPSFREVLARVRTTALGAYAHQDLPFEKLVEELAPARDLSRNPLFQVSFNLQNMPDTPLVIDGVDVTHLPLEGRTSKFDLTLSVRESAGGLRATWNYATDLFDAATIAHLAEHFHVLLEAIVADPERPVGHLALLTDAERRQLLITWNDTATDYETDRCAHQLFEHQVTRTPDAVAVVYENEQLTYAELNSCANQLAHRLIGLGVGPEVLVGLYTARSLEMVIGMLGILKAGGAYVPFDPNWPAERARLVMEDARVVAMVAQHAHGDRRPSGPVPVVFVEPRPERVDGQIGNPVVPVSTANLAYVLYTSGTTGVPKGVLVEHRQLVQYAWAVSERLELDARGRYAMVQPLTVDACQTMIFPSLGRGGTLHLISEARALDATRLAEYFRDHPVDYLKIAPSHLAALLEQLPSAALLPERALVLGGEASHWDFLDQLWSLPSRCAIWNHYGPTETTVGVSASRLNPAGARHAKTAPIGRPLANVQYYVLDRRLEPVPAGCPGELFIGGAQVVRGYLNRPELTAERFLRDPFGKTPGARLYRSGDHVRYLPDGQIEFLGRKDQQVKVRGFRIELGEIEAVLREIEGVREAVVSVGEAAAGGKRLVAFVVTDEHAPLDDQLRTRAAARLPEYMVPSQFVRLQQLPLNPHGKIDRRALVVPEAGGSPFDAPVGEIETTLAHIWADVLKVDRIGRKDHFFELGGHSLLAVSLLERMRRAGLHADVRALFVTPTLSELAAAVAADNASVEVPANRIPPGCAAITPDMVPLVHLTPGDIERIAGSVTGGAANIQDIYPLAPLQEGILFHHQMSTGGDLYLTSSMLAFDSRPGLQRYLAALQAVIDRHDVLRTAVLWEGLPEPVQVVWRRAPLVLEEVSFGEEGDVVHLLRERFNPRHHRLDLHRAPIMRVVVAHDPANARWVMLRLFHHVLSDHTSSAVMSHEIKALLLGQADRLPAPIPFRNFVAQAKLAVPEEEHRRFFHQMLGDVDEPTSPFGLTDVHEGGSGIVEAQLALDASLARRLRERARSIGVSAASVVHTAWAQVLARVSGRDDVVFGTVLFGRMQGGAGADRALGLFMNTLPIRIRLGDRGVEESVRDTHALLAELLRHEHAPLALAQRCSAVPAPTPLFGALLNYRHTPVAEVSGRRQGLGGIVALAGHTSRTNYPLKAAVTDQGESFMLSVQAQAPIDPQRVCSYLQTALERLVDALEDAPNTPLRSIDVLPASERAFLPDPTQPIDETAQPPVVGQVLEWARADPERVAVRAAGCHWSYSELTARATALATRLQELGVGRGDVVAIVGTRSAGLIGAMLGVLMSGGAFLTIDPALPARRKRVMLSEARAKVVCAIGSSNEIDDCLEADDVRTVLRTDLELASLLASDGGDRRAWSIPAFEGNDPAYVFFTSGSTGQPKAILGCHKGLSHFLQWQRSAFAVGPEDRVSQLIGLTFDPLLRDVFLPLTSGATVCVPADGDLTDVLGWIEREGITVVHTTPTLLHSWLLPGEWTVALPSLRWLFISGEPLTDSLIARWRRLVTSPAQLVNFYGPSETTMIRCFHVVPAEVAGGVQPIGAPLPDSQALVLNPAGRLCGIGEIGEIVLRTPFHSLGYLNLPDETARRFRPNPFRDDANDLVYFTGDRGRYRPDGLLEIAGRVDDQVKIRGVRIDPGEVTATLARHEAVRHCVVVGRNEADGQSALVGYIVPEPGRPISAGELRAYLAGELPHAFIPGAFVFLDALPVLPNGKIDRRALPAPQVERKHDGGVSEGSRNPLEEVIAEVWREVLRIDEVGVHDSFFELGGHSLTATQMLARLTRLLQIELPLRSFFDSPTVAALAAEARRRLGDGLNGGEIGLVPTSRETGVPLSFAQQRLWFLDQLEPQTSAYNMPAAWRLDGALELTALNRSVDALVARHEVLRTRVALRAGAPVQVIDPVPHDVVKVTDLSGLEPQAREARAQILIAAHACQPFNLEAGPLFRAELLRLAPEEHVLLLNVHHLVSDGWSVGVFHRDLATAYRAFLRGAEPVFQPLPIQYADYAVWQRVWLQGPQMAAQSAYWHRQLATLNPLELPTDHPRPPTTTRRGADLVMEVPPETTEALKALAGREGVTLFMTLLSAFKVLLHRHSGQTDIAVGSPIAGRGRPELDEMIGLFVNTLVLRSDVSDRPSFRELLARVRDTTLSAYAHSDIPFEKLVEELAPIRDMTRQPLFQVLFTLQNTPTAPLVLDDLEVRHLPRETRATKFDLTLSIREASGGLRLRWEYARDLFDAPTIVRLAGHLQVLIEAILTDPDQRIDALPILTEPERHQLLVMWNDTAADYPRERCVHQLFEAQVTRTADAAAVIFEGQQLTYAALNARANQVAHQLQALGAGSGTVVGLCVDRSLDLIVGLLGILKAGAAYVPLDPGYPAARIAFMLTDTRAHVLVTQHALLAQLPPFSGDVLCLDRDAAVIGSQPESNPPGGASAESLAYVIYTSGSTGAPKGVAIAHRAVVNLLTSMARVPGLGPEDVLVAVTTLSFDIAVLELQLPLTVGATVVIATRACAADGNALGALLEQQRATVLQATPATWRLLLEGGWIGASLRKALVGGEAMSPDLAARLLATGVEVWNMYGPTETTVWSTSAHITDASRAMTIGYPIANTRVRIMDTRGALCPIGVPGELCIGGDGVAVGYWNRPDLTTERFVPDPFSAVPGARMYRTGDRARYRADGSIEFVGRLDNQVKIRGFRIEPGEVETVLGGHASVRQAVVLCRQDSPGDQRLVAYVVPADDAGIDVESLRRFLRTRLPDYMQPAAYVVLEQLPLTPAGKLDRKALLAPQYGRAASDSFVEPRDVLEELIAQVWREVLRIERIGVHDNFFESGGHSLLATQVVARLSRLLRVELPLKKMFEAPTIADLAVALLHLDRGSTESTLDRILREVEALPDEEPA